MNQGARARLPLAAAGLAVAALTAWGAARRAAAPAATAVSPAKQVATITLNVWDQEVRGGQAEAIKKLNAQFEAMYRTSRSSGRQVLHRPARDAEARGLGPNPPDVVEANNGYSAMGPLVQAGCSCRSTPTRRRTGGATATRRGSCA